MPNTHSVIWAKYSITDLELVPDNPMWTVVIRDLLHGVVTHLYDGDVGHHSVSYIWMAVAYFVLGQYQTKSLPPYGLRQNYWHLTQDWSSLCLQIPWNLTVIGHHQVLCWKIDIISFHRSPVKGSIMRTLGVSFVVSMNKLLDQQSICRLFETP